jgi:flagellar biosynthesis/type III secretory pathway M-ring protein FliF/YscJ
MARGLTTMDPNTKDLIGLVSKLLGVLSVFVAIFVAWWQVEKTRRERKEQAARDAMQRQKELEARELQIKVTQAAFWLELRKMFAEHNDVHFNLRPGGSWYQSDTSPSSSDLPKVEAYMGLFEHCQRMIDDGLLDLATD